MNVGRYSSATALAALVTFSLVFTMQSLINSGSRELEKPVIGKVIDFVRLRRESAIEAKKRELPSKKEADAPPPDIDASSLPDLNPGDLAPLAASSFAPELDLAGGPSLAGAGPSDADAIPLVRVNPQYPSKALIAGVEGWVHLEFTVTPTGGVKDIQVVDADPRNYFEQAATQAVSRYRYKPKVENGTSVERPGVQVVISFKLNKQS